MHGSKKRIRERISNLDSTANLFLRKKKVVKINSNDKIQKCKTANKTSKIQCITCGKIINSKNKYKMCKDCYTNYIDELKIKNWIRRYIYKKQNFKCAICGIETKWNNKNLNFILDHIDGNASNNREENLRLICPNCDSQLPTFKSKNKNSARSNKHHN